MLRLFKRGTRKRLRSMATTTPCTTYQEFFEVLLRVEDLENAPDDEDEDDDRNAQRNTNRGNHHLIHEGLRTLRKVKTTLDRRAGVQTLVHLVEAANPLAVPVFQSQGNSNNSSAQLCHKCNTSHFGKCKRGNRGCFTCERWGTWPIIVLRTRGINLLFYHLQPPTTVYSTWYPPTDRLWWSFPLSGRCSSVQGRTIPVHT